MPSTCRLITRPMIRRLAPPWCMCRGVITITLTMTVWPSAIVTRPSSAPGWASRVRQPRTMEPCCRSSGSVATAAARSRASSERVGSQPDEQQDRPEHEAPEGEDVGAGEGRDPEEPRDRLSRACEVGPEDRADRRRPHHGGQVAPAVGLVGEVGRGIPGLAVGGVGAAEHGAPTRSSGKLRIAPAMIIVSAPTMPMA